MNNANYGNMSIERIIFDTFQGIPAKIMAVLSNFWSWIMSVFVFIGAFLGDKLPLLAYISVAIVIDALWGISTARRAGRFIFSTLIKKSAIKIAAYASLYSLVALVDKAFGDTFMITSTAMASILIVSEMWSILGHIAIAKPNLIAVKLLRKHLRGEMARKLGITEDEIEKIINDEQT